MPLPAPTCARAPSYQRTITVSTHVRADGLWDIDGHLVDVWPDEQRIATGPLPGGQPMHEMWLRLTVDRTATIVAAVASTDAGPYGTACASITPDYSRFVGVKIARGYRDAIRQRFGRTAGCTHINELASVMGSAALQALWHELTGDPDVQPFSIDGCHALRSSGPQVAEFFPRWYRPAGPAATATAQPGRTEGDVPGHGGGLAAVR
ncbi:MAG: hypothetical protein RLZZ584_1466 [Pseudomonadota bacterium]